MKHAAPDPIEAIFKIYGMAPLHAAAIRAKIDGRSTRQMERIMRHDKRDESIRAAVRDFYPHSQKKKKAEAFLADFDRYLSTAWRDDREGGDVSDNASQKRKSLFEIACLNDGCTLGWRQIVNILEGRRSG